MPEPEIKINLKLDAAEAQKALEDVKRKAESLQSVNTSTGGASVSVSAETTAKDTAAWRENTEAKKAATETHDALGAAVGKVSEQVAVNTATTAQNTAAWRENAEARTLAMADTEGAAERIERMAEAQAKLAQASAQAAGAWTQAKKPVTDYTASLELQTKTYEELLQLYEELMERRAAAQTAEEVKEIDIQLNAVRKNMRMMGQDARMSGAQVIGSQRSIQGVFRATISQWRKGTLTLKGLTQDMAMFAKSTVFLAAIQLAWELLTNVWEKAKVALFGTADAAEAAAEKQQKLADAAKDASENLLAAQEALAAAREDKVRKDAAQALSDEIKAQNDYYKEQIKLVNEATAAQLRQLTVTSKEDERKMALEKLKLQQDLMAGLIDEYEYKDKLIRLENEAVQKNLANETEKKRIAMEDAAKKMELADKERTQAYSAQQKDMTGFEMDVAVVAEKVARYNALKAERDKNITEYSKGKIEEEKLLRVLNYGGKTYEENLKDPHIATYVREAKKKLDELQPFLRRYEADGEERQRLYKEIPEFVRKVGLTDSGVNRYEKEQSSRNAYNQKIQNEADKANEAVKKSIEEYNKAQLAYDQAVSDNVEAAKHAAKLAENNVAINRFNEHNAKKNAENEKRIQAARDKVNSMEYAELKAEEKRLLAEAAKVGDRTPEGKRLAALAGVYTTERRSRDTAARRVKDDLQFFARGTRGKTRANINAVGEAAEDAVQVGSVNLSTVLALAEKVQQTKKNKADDKAFLELVKLVKTLLTEEQQNSQKAKDLEREVKRIQNKMTKS